MTKPSRQAHIENAAKSDRSGPAGALAALMRASNAAQKVAKLTQTEVITVANSSVAKQLNALAKP